MSDYDAAFDAAAKGKASSPYDEVMKSVSVLMQPQPQVAETAPAVVQAGAAVNSIPRQLGLTARYGIEGLANTAQLLTEPIRYVTDRLTGQTGKTKPIGAVASEFLDSVGLPKPEGATERVIGDASRLMAGSFGMAKGAQALGGVASDALQFAGKNAPAVFQSTGQKIAQTLGQNQTAQLSSAAGAGLAGGSSREAGGSPLMQGLAALGGGVAGGLAPGVLGSAANAAKGALSRTTPQEIDVRINAIMERAGIDYSQVPERVRQSLRLDLAQALRTGDDLNPAAVRRLADFRTTGLTPTRGSITQDPVQITREMNLAKTGANSADGELQGLARVQNQNNATIIQRLNEAGGRTEAEPLAAGRAVAGAVLGRRDALRNAETAAWNEARNSPGYRQPIEANVVSQINQALGDEGMMPFLNPTISRYMEAFMNGQQPFTPQAYRNLQSMLSNEMSQGGNPAAAAGIARRVLERAELRPITNPRGIDFGNALVTQDTASRLRALDAAPRQSIDAVNNARSATRAAYAYEESSPLVRSVLSDGRGSDPMRIAQQYVLGGTPDEAAVVARELGPQGREVIKNVLATYIKKQAVGGANDDVGKVSQSALNAVLRNIGDEKLRLFFSPEEINQLRAVGRVASYVQVQPAGSAVNNSNSGAMLIGRGLDALSGLANSTPFLGPWVSQPLTSGLRNLNVELQTRQAQNVGPGILTQALRPRLSQSILLPAAAAAGTVTPLLAAP